ncbi:MAG: hypothetical protein EBT82_00995 [Micrococcales bacterium]|nr:hypothetical protein [Micrococcales bacterium]NBR54549.1 hypothetical protein [Micrococcales bacterium]NBR61372.1 hypothetical protein [Actinomycetota bacterium]NBY43869.1 hypothetical protein [Micrococcales bacterium]
MILRSFKFATVSLCLVLALTSCTVAKGPQANHKPATSACLISSQESLPGSPDRQLGVDLVEAQVVYGIRVKEVVIPKYADKMSKLLSSLQSGCVLMVSSDDSLLNSLSSFARLHSKMMVLFVGGNIAAADQPANLRWVADDVTSGAKLAGFAAASLGSEVNLLVQKNYFQSAAIQAGFRSGVDDFNSLNSESVKLNVTVLNSKKELTQKLQLLVEPSVVALFAGNSYWSSIGPVKHQLLGADLQFGQTRKLANPQLVGSLERNTSAEVLRAVSSLLARKIASSPSYRKTECLKAGRILLRLNDGLATGLADYRSQLLNK